MFGTSPKRAAERVVADSGCRGRDAGHAFHDLVLVVARQLAKLPVVPVPAGSRFQPVHPHELAARLGQLTLGPPAGLVPDLGGPRVYRGADLVRGYLQASHQHRPIVPVWLPGKAARAVRAGANLAPGRAVGTSWEASSPSGALVERQQIGAEQRTPAA